MTTLLTLLFTLLAVPSSFRMMVISDPHVLDQSLFTTSSAAMKQVMVNDLNQYEYAQAAFTQLIDQALTNKPDVVLIPGDMTMNGARASHETVATLLRRLTEAGIPVCLIPGENDINNSNAASYLGETPQSVPSISSAEFDSLYAFTHETWSNLRKDPYSHSYVVTLAPRLTLIGVDCSMGDIDGLTMSWILAQADSAKVKDDRVIAMMHYQLLEHTDELGTLYPQALVDDYETVAQTFRQHGIELVLTGHMHYSNASTNYLTTSRDSLVEISTGTPVMYPSPYRMITVSGERNQFSCTTQYVTSLAGNTTFSATNNKQHVVDNIQNVQLRGLYDIAWEYRDSVGPKIDGFQIDAKLNSVLEVLGLGKDDIKGFANNLIAQIPSDSKTRADYINKFVGVDASTTAIIHIEGNENEKNTEDLKKNLIKDVYNLVYDLIDKAYPYNEKWWTISGATQNAKRDGWFDKADIVYKIVSPYETAGVLYRNLDAVKEVKEVVQDFLDGFFGDYTYYKDKYGRQNRTDDLNPSLRFATLPHRDYYAIVTFDLRGFGKNVVDSVLINDPNTITRPKDPQHEGWAFVGWYEDEELTKPYDFNTEISGFEDRAITLYAKWIRVVIFALGDTTKMYDGTPIAPKYKDNGVLPKSCTTQIEVDTILTNVGSVIYRVTNTIIWSNTTNVTENYKIEWTVDSALMAITPRPVSLSLLDVSTRYTGDTLKVGYIYQGDLVKGDSLKTYISNSQLVDVDTIIAHLDSVIILNAQGQDVTTQYAITIAKGEATLIITPRQIDITTASDSMRYNGTELRAERMTMTGDGFIEGEGIDVIYTGSQIEVGSSDNTIEYTALPGTKLSNYDILVTYGTLTVLPQDVPTRLSSPSSTQQVEKFLYNNQLYIRQGNKLYNALGQEL